LQGSVLVIDDVAMGLTEAFGEAHNMIAGFIGGLA